MPIDFTCPHCGANTNVADQYAGHSGPCSSCGQTITIPRLQASEAVAAAPLRSSSLPVILIVVVCVLGLGFLVCGGVMVALLLPAIQSGRNAGQRAVCENNMRQIAAAMELYALEHGTYPPAYVADKNGKPMHSWRVLLLPYLEQKSLYDQYDFDEPWDGPNNRLLADQMPEVYRCPDDDLIDHVETSYVVISGKGAVFDGVKKTAAGDIKDDLGKTLLLVESAFADIHWMEPRDLELEQMSDQINSGEEDGIFSFHTGGAHVCFADGQVQLLFEDTAPEDLKAMISIDGGEVVDVH